MRDALAATGRKILYSICEWGVNNPWTWAPQVGNSWRTTGDIQDNYSSMLSIFNQNVWLYPHAGPGAWNDPDMLEIGNGGMTTTEYQSEFSLWAAMDAPLLAGTDLRTISPADLKIYTNKNVIAVNQDPLGRQAVPVPAGGEPAGNDGLWVLSNRWPTVIAPSCCSIRPAAPRRSARRPPKSACRRPRTTGCTTCGPTPRRRPRARSWRRCRRMGW